MVTFDQMKDLIILVTLTWLHVQIDQLKDLIILVTLTWLHLTK